MIEHLYIERRMTPLNLYLQNGSDADVEHGVKEYGNAVKELMKANIFPGDMLYKHLGVTRHGRVVFYDYDEIEYLTDRATPRAGAAQRGRRAVRRTVVPSARTTSFRRPTGRSCSATARATSS